MIQMSMTRSAFIIRYVVVSPTIFFLLNIVIFASFWLQLCASYSGKHSAGTRVKFLGHTNLPIKNLILRTSEVCPNTGYAEIVFLTIRSLLQKETVPFTIFTAILDHIPSWGSTNVIGRFHTRLAVEYLPTETC